MNNEGDATVTRYPQNNLAACMLPWTKDFQLDEPVFEAHVNGAINDGYKCLYVMGTAGEGQPIVVIYGACHSGSFIEPAMAADSISGADRIVVTSSRGVSARSASIARRRAAASSPAVFSAVSTKT